MKTVRGIVLVLVTALITTSGIRNAGADARLLVKTIAPPDDPDEPEEPAPVQPPDIEVPEVPSNSDVPEAGDDPETPDEPDTPDAPPSPGSSTPTPSPSPTPHEPDRRGRVWDLSPIAWKR